MTEINISDEEHTAERQPQQEELPHKAEGEQPKRASANQNKGTESEQQARTENEENVETNARTEMPQPEEVGEQQQQQQQNEEPLKTQDQSILDILNKE